jgi:hypothetical protein
MRRYLLVVVASCSIPDKTPTADDPGGDGSGGALDTRITQAPDAFSKNPVATFAFTSNVPGATFTCRIDNSAPTECTSPFSKRLDDGSHRFSVRATDGNGANDESPAEHVWAIDTVAPRTMLTETPPAADNSTMVTFAFTSDEANVVFECSLDNATFKSCKSGDSFGPVRDGAHAFSVRAKDRAGNVDPSPAIYAWQVDTSTPDTILLAMPPNASPTGSATFTFVSPDAGPGATFECALDSDLFLPCASPQTYNGLPEATHTFRVRVRDGGGNVDPTPATDTWRVDLTPPETTISSGPSGAIAATSVSFTFTANEGDVEFACILDGAMFAPCTSPFNATSLAQGAHTFSVRATDAAGHDDPTPAVATWTVDTVMPTIEITDGPAEGSTVGPRATLRFTASEGMTECSIDGSPFTTCGSPVAYNLPAGSHAFAVRAVDGAGNTATATRSWMVACSAPDLTDAAGLLHFDDGSQVQPNATGGPAAILGSTDSVDDDDPMPVTGRFGGGLDFASSEDDIVGWPIGLGEVDDLTLELWARPDAAFGTRDVLVNGSGRIAIRVTLVSLTEVVFSATFEANGPASYTVVSAPVAANRWHWIHVTLQEPTLRLWVNGAATTEQGVRLGPGPSLDVMQIGGDYRGALDELFVSRSAMSDDVALSRYCPL